jgi:hypothetical protein
MLLVHDACMGGRVGYVSASQMLLVVWSAPNDAARRAHACTQQPASQPAGFQNGDFHFWRLDITGTWSYKAGDTLVRLYVHAVDRMRVPACMLLKHVAFRYVRARVRVHYWHASSSRVCVCVRACARVCVYVCVCACVCVCV